MQLATLAAAGAARTVARVAAELEALRARLREGRGSGELREAAEAARERAERGRGLAQGAVAAAAAGPSGEAGGGKRARLSLPAPGAAAAAAEELPARPGTQQREGKPRTTARCGGGAAAGSSRIGNAGSDDGLQQRQLRQSSAAGPGRGRQGRERGAEDQETTQ